MPKKTRQYEDEPEPNQILGIGSFDSFTAVPATDKPKKKDQIGFIRNDRRKVHRKVPSAVRKNK